ncbi:hypothetical protein [Pectobacterium brasiliense]|uniref:hypothetical protein n=1 Tax=Pectobacterium brasiliense TaxID=180957 RepID=UPI000907910F|nr:hypothetical protein [Pectobacterium brasiliense]
MNGVSLCAGFRHQRGCAGEPERISQAQRRADGIDLSDQEWQKIVEAGIALGMNPAEFTLIA